MKIYLNTDGTGRGGPNRWAARFIQELRERGYVVTHDVNTRFDAAYLNIATAGIEKLVERRIPFLYRVAGCNIPEWFPVMGKLMDDAHRQQNDLIRHALEISPKVIYQSQWAKAQLDRLLYKRENHFAVVYNGVSKDFFMPGPSHDVPVIAAAGSLRYRYRLKTLFRLSDELALPHQILIAGALDSENEVVLHERLQAGQSDVKVRYAGDLAEPDWAEALKRCDVLFHPVCGDSCPNVVVEALMSGVAIVAPRFGGTAELVGRGGILFECEPWDYFSPTYTKNAVDACRNVLAERAHYRREARLRAEHLLDLQQMVDAYLQELNLPKRIVPGIMKKSKVAIAKVKDHLRPKK